MLLRGFFQRAFAAFPGDLLSFCLGKLLGSGLAALAGPELGERHGGGISGISRDLSRIRGFGDDGGGERVQVAGLLLPSHVPVIPGLNLGSERPGVRVGVELTHYRLPGLNNPSIRLKAGLLPGSCVGGS